MLRFKTLPTLLFAVAFFSSGCGDSPESDSEASVNESTQEIQSRDSSWYMYTSREFAFELEVLFEPNNILEQVSELDAAQSSPLNDNRLALTWPVANPDYEVTVYAQEMPISISFKDSQKRILEPSIDSALKTAGARIDDTLKLEWLEKNDRLYVIARTLKEDSNHKVWLLACVAYKAMYMVWITEDEGHDAEEEAERILASFRVLEEPPTAIKDAAEADTSAIYIGEDADSELLEELNWALRLADDPDRGIGYTGPFNQPELNAAQEQNLKKIMRVLETPCPFPWETWIFNVRMPLASANESIADWAKVAIVWQRFGDESMPDAKQQDIVSAAYFSAKGFNPGKVNDDGTFALTSKEISVIHEFTKQLTTTDLEQWFSSN